MKPEDSVFAVSEILDRLDEYGSPEDLQQIHDALVGLVQAAVAEERQACAQLAYDRQQQHDDRCQRECKCADGYHLAVAIMARGRKL